MKKEDLIKSIFFPRRYKNKDKKFNSPAFNFDEVVKIPNKGICLASNKINKVQGLYFEVNKTKIWGLQYHPEITYEKITTISFSIPCA